MKLRIGVGRYDRTQALLDGRVRVSGHEVEFESPPLETLFATAFDTDSYDAAELSFSNFLYLSATQGCRFTGLPIFPSRMFRHSALFIRTDRGINTPRDLIGKVVGVREFSMTAALVARGVLEDEYGVRAADIDWRYGPADDSDSKPVVRVSPRGVRTASIDNGKNLSDMLEQGELDAMVAYKPPKAFLNGAAHVGRLFPDPAPIEQDYFARTGIFPIMHLIGIRRELGQDPEVCKAICNAFQEAKTLAISELGAYQALAVSLPWAPTNLQSVERAMGKSFWPYGLQSNIAAIDSIARYSYTQGLAPRLMTLDDLFARGARDWTP